MAWGIAPVPLLPESLRLAWQQERLPDWVCQDLALPTGSTYSRLDGSIWKSRSFLPARILTFIRNLVKARSAGIEPMRVFTEPLPFELQVQSLPLTNRVRNSLIKGRLLRQPDRLSNLDYGDLFSRHGLGIKSVLDFACTIEAFRGRGPAGCNRALSPDSEHGSSDLLKFLDKTEAGQISAQDIRFCDILAAMPGTVADHLESESVDGALGDGAKFLTAEVVNALRQRIERIRSLPLDICLRELIAQTARLDDRKLSAVCARFGFDGPPPVTLEEAGRRIGVTTERARQLEQEVRKRLPKHDLFVPRLDDAIDLLRHVVAIPTTDAARLMVERGICSKPFSPQSIISAAGLCGRPALFSIVSRLNSRWLVRRAYVHHVWTIATLARRQAEASGASSVRHLLEELTIRKKNKSTEEEIRRFLASVPGIEFLEGDWFWYQTGKYARNRLRNIARKILSVAGPVDVGVIREGVGRVCQFRRDRGASGWPLAVPPQSVLKRFFEVHPEFVVDQEGQIGPAEALDCRIELTITEQILVDVLRATPVCVIDRATYRRRCVDRGMNIQNFCQYLTFSPLISPLGTDLWSLRGVRSGSSWASGARAFKQVQRPRQNQRLVSSHSSIAPRTS